MASQSSPDYSIAGTITTVLMFLPGASAGLVGFLIFGTVAPFRHIYAESMRECCRCQCQGKRKTRAEVNDIEGGRGWRTLGGINPRMRDSGYHCRVWSVGHSKLDLSHVAPEARKKEGVVHGVHELREPPPRLEQPWRTLGITPIQKYT